MCPIFETPRLILRPLALSDAPAIQQYFANWDVIKNMGDGVPWPYPPDGAEYFVKSIALPEVSEGRAHIWAITLKPSDECVGVMHMRLYDHPEGHRGFWLAKHLWGQGLMREAVSATNDYVFGPLGWDAFMEHNADFNAGSRALKVFSGGELLETREKAGAGGVIRKTEVWRITREGWQKIP
ncbi:MAG: GNAT family N-acetyltransferase [Alphaproteobacteria bacterium]|nr:GNAT family N-acetyltransferase [Alphaproteobacteria bacterium]